jgi:ActR/RegA family two-component response regulator
VVDLKLKGNSSGLACVQMLHQHDAAMLIVVLTGFASINTAVEAIKLGACQYLAKPSNTDDIEAAFEHVAGAAELELTNRATSVKTLEWEHIHTVLAETDFNISEAARRLGMHRARWRASWKNSASSRRQPQPQAAANSNGLRPSPTWLRTQLRPARLAAYSASSAWL